MRAFIRSLLTLLLLLALPLQGIAAASMVNCLPAHGGMAGAASLSAVSADGLHDALHAPGDHCADARLPTQGKHACSACAACCIGGALMPSALALPGDFKLHERPLRSQTLSPAFITEGTERPPRAFSS